MKKVQFNLLHSVALALALVFLFAACGEEGVVEEEKIFLDIEITKLPDRTTFRLGEEPDFSGLEVVEVYTDSTRKPNTNFKVSWSADVFKKGITKATVTARNRNKTFDITFEGDSSRP